MRIIIDAMGGDNAPKEIVKGAVRAKRELGVDVTLVGIEDRVRACLEAEGCGDIDVVNASEVITMEDDPSTATRRKKDSSMAVALTMLKDGKGDAVVSAGSTGALLTGATLTVKRIHGIRRAALAPVLPAGEHGVMLIDCGANVECTAEYLLQFATMGAHYMQSVLGVAQPRVGLLNNGAEEHKGMPLQQETYQLLKTAPVNFIGNIEGRDVPLGAADVIVADGFTGNILLKTMEGVGLFFAGELKSIFLKNAASKLAALLVRDGIRSFKKKMDYNETGGAPLLGIAKPGIKAHGSSKAKTFESAIAQAVTYVEQGVIDKIARSVESGAEA